MLFQSIEASLAAAKKMREMERERERDKDKNKDEPNVFIPLLFHETN